MKTSANRGFTLIEMVVTLFIFILVGTVALTGFVRGQRLYAAQTDQMDVQDNSLIAVRNLIREIQETHGIGNNGDANPGFYVNSHVTGANSAYAILFLSARDGNGHFQFDNTGIA